MHQGEQSNPTAGAQHGFASREEPFTHPLQSPESRGGEEAPPSPTLIKRLAVAAILALLCISKCASSSPKWKTNIGFLPEKGIHWGDRVCI